MGHPQVKYTLSFLEAITPTMDPFLGYAVYQFILCYVIYYNLKLEVKIDDNVLKIAILYKNVVCYLGVLLWCRCLTLPASDNNTAIHQDNRETRIY
jgi:hypothetical protein